MFESVCLRELHYKPVVSDVYFFFNTIATQTSFVNISFTDIAVAKNQVFD